MLFHKDGGPFLLAQSMPEDEISLLVIDLKVSPLRCAHPDIFTGIVCGNAVSVASKGDQTISPHMAKKLLRANKPPRW